MQGPKLPWALQTWAPDNPETQAQAMLVPSTHWGTGAGTIGAPHPAIATPTSNAIAGFVIGTLPGGA